MLAGLLLTGGQSRRLGFDKARLRLDGETLAERGARVLVAVCAPVLEVGPGASGLPAVREDPPGSGPLAALAAGGAALRARGHAGGALLLGVDLPFVEPPLLELLVHDVEDGAVVPIAAGEPQPMCAAYGPGALRTAGELVAAGERALKSLLRTIDVRQIDEAAWREVAPPDALDDVDTPDDLERLGFRAN